MNVKAKAIFHKSKRKRITRYDLVHYFKMRSLCLIEVEVMNDVAICLLVTQGN